MPTLFVVATPIGNLEDISMRALRVLDEVSLIAAEDTRKTRQLLSAFGLSTPTTSYHEHNKLSKLPSLLDRLVEGDVALVSEAGMPGISDPGYELVTAAIERGVRVEPVPGPSVLITALAVSGLPTDRFTYLGFLPRRKGPRMKIMESVAGEERTLIAFESPHRLLASLGDMRDVLGDRRIAVCRELTKVYEEVFRGRISEAIAHFAEPRGEFTLVVEGRAKEESKVSADTVDRLRRLRDEGLPAKEAVARVTRESGIPRREVYRAWLSLG